MKKKKGFTLVELLAVIVILSILVLLAVPSVLKMMNGSKDNAFKIEAENIIAGGKLKYSDDLLNGTLPAATSRTISSATVTGYCYNITGLTDYIDKNFTGKVGSVLIDATNNNYYIWYTDGSRSITASSTVKGGSIALDATAVTAAAATTAKWNNCLN